MTTGTPSLCPCCGTPVQVVGSEEGTQSYRPVVTDEMVERVRRAMFPGSSWGLEPWEPPSVSIRECLTAALTFEKGDDDA